jgi:cell division protein FtsB
VVLNMTYEGMLEEIEAADKVKQLEKELDIIKTENEIKDFEIKTLKEKIDMLQKQKKILQNSIRKYGKKNNS